MKIVIDIPEDSYKATCDGCMLPPDVKSVVQGIKNGVPLPDGAEILTKETYSDLCTRAADVPGKNVRDLISRQAVDELSKALVHTTRDKADFLCNFWEGLQKLPPLIPKAEQRWIPCSERMPEKHGDYLVTIENGDVFNCYFNPDYCYDGYDNGAFTYTQEHFDHETMGSLGAEEFAYDGVVAWMSYEPYKEESEV